MPNCLCSFCAKYFFFILYCVFYIPGRQVFFDLHLNELFHILSSDVKFVQSASTL